MPCRDIPALFSQASSADFEGAPQEVLDWLHAPIESTYIFGANGVGKSYLAAARAQMSFGKRALWCSVPWLMIRIRRTFKPRVEESELEILEELIDAPFLILDDLMAAKASDYGLSILLAIVNGKIENQTACVVTCDRTLEQLDSWDSSLASRLGSYKVLRLVGFDRRLDRHG